MTSRLRVFCLPHGEVCTSWESAVPPSPHPHLWVWSWVASRPLSHRGPWWLGGLPLADLELMAQGLLVSFLSFSGRWHEQEGAGARSFNQAGAQVQWDLLRGCWEPTLSLIQGSFDPWSGAGLWMLDCNPEKTMSVNGMRGVVTSVLADWGSYKGKPRQGILNNRHFFLPGLEAGHPRSRHLQIPCLVRASCWFTYASPRCVLTWRRGRELSVIRILIPSWGLHPRDLVNSQRPHLLTPAHWGLGFNYANSGGTQIFSL